jgi:glycosyltransferase involved in cell wall biosynthesis
VRWAADPRPLEDVEVDVLIPTRNRAAELAVTLAGLAAQDGPVFRTVVSDQSDGAPAWIQAPVAAVLRVLEAQGTRVELLRHLPRRGLAEHRQFLLEQATGEKTLFLDDDVWLEPGALGRMAHALDELRCGFVGMAPQGFSYLKDRRPEETRSFAAWDGTVAPERVRPAEPAFERWPLHSAANLSHLSVDLGLEPGQWLAYKVAWLGGCTMFRRAALEDVGGFRFWTELPPEHCGEDVVAQWNVMEKYGGAGILPTGAVHLESPTTVTDRRIEAFNVVLGAPGEPGEKESNNHQTKGTDMDNTPDPIRIQKFLGGVDYPATKDSLLAHAKNAGADSDVLNALNHIPEIEYDGPTSVSSAVSDG